MTFKNYFISAGIGIAVFAAGYSTGAVIESNKWEKAYARDTEQCLAVANDAVETVQECAQDAQNFTQKAKIKLRDLEHKISEIRGINKETRVLLDQSNK